MESRKLFPIRDRLDNLQINELEGYRANSNYQYNGVGGTLLTASKTELLLRYHAALEVAEKELEKYAHVDEGVNKIRNTLDKHFPDE